MCKNLKKHMKRGHINFSHIHVWWKCNAPVSDRMVYHAWIGLKLEEFEETHEEGSQKILSYSRVKLVSILYTYKLAAIGVKKWEY